MPDSTDREEGSTDKEEGSTNRDAFLQNLIKAHQPIKWLEFQI